MLKAFLLIKCLYRVHAYIVFLYIFKVYIGLLAIELSIDVYADVLVNIFSPVIDEVISSF